MEIDVIESDFYYHIYNRGINRQPIFSEDCHYYKFMELCKKYLSDYADILAYCLIPNHFHFLLYIHPDGVGVPRRGGDNPLGVLFNAYAQWFNSLTDRTGGLFQRPFKRKRIESNEYLKQTIYYIHRNPLHHGLTTDPSEYTFSSFQAYLNNIPSIVKREDVFDWFDGPSNFKEYHKMKFDIDCSEYFDEF